MSALDRFLPRDTRLLVRLVLVPLTVLHVGLTAYAVVTAHQASERMSRSRLETLAQALAVSSDEVGSDDRLDAIAREGGLDRIWIVSATGRILSSSRNGERETFVEDRWWADLSPDAQLVHRTVEWGGRTYQEIAFQDIADGRWAIIVGQRAQGVWNGRLAWIPILLLSLVVWLVWAGWVALVVGRRIGGGQQQLSDLTRRVLDGEAVAQAHVERVLASLGSHSPMRYLGVLVHRLQERAVRANEAESRFSLALDMMPGMAYVASYDGSLLLAGAELRRRCGETLPLGRSVGQMDHIAPFSRIHGVISHARAHGVTFDALPIDGAEGLTVLVSARSVRLRDVQGYLAVVRESESDSSETPASSPDALLSAVFEADESLVMVFDDAARTVIWNETAIRVTGYLPDDVPDITAVIARLYPDAAERNRFIEWLDRGVQGELLESTIETAGGDFATLRWQARELLAGGSRTGGMLRAEAIGSERGTPDAEANDSERGTPGAEAIDSERGAPDATPAAETASPVPAETPQADEPAETARADESAETPRADETAEAPTGRAPRRKRRRRSKSVRSSKQERDNG